MKRLIYRVAGPPPGKGAPRLEQLRWIRRLNLRWSAPPIAVCAVLLLLVAPWYFAAACVVLQAYSLASISLAISREQRKERARTGS
jgi:hypothetical protein